MGESLLSRIFAKISIAILILAVFDLLYINYWMIQSTKKSAVQNDREVTRPVEKAASPSPSPSDTTSPTPSPTVKTETIVEKQTQTVIQTAQKEIFIPVGSGSTFSQTYVDLAGLSVDIDTTKYSPIDNVVFEASIWLQDGNGKTYARLYQKDSGGVLGSEITTSSPTSTLNSSSKFGLGGSHTYKVQAKTDLPTYAAHVEGARIKITLK